MSNQGKLSNLSAAEKSIKEAANTPDDKDSKEEKSDMQSEGGHD